MEIFELTKIFPKEEKFSLTDSLGEEFETEDWLDYSKDCGYITLMQHESMILAYDEVRKMLISTINDPEKWCI